MLRTFVVMKQLRDMCGSPRFATSTFANFKLSLCSRRTYINELSLNTFAASYLNTQGLNNSCLKSQASTLVDLTFQSRTPLFQLKSAT